jgi:hypothetical protein
VAVGTGRVRDNEICSGAGAESGVYNNEVSFGRELDVENVLMSVVSLAFCVGVGRPIFHSPLAC